MSLITIATDGFTIFNAFIFTSPLRNRGGQLSPFYNCVTARQRGKVICPKSCRKCMESRMAGHQVSQPSYICSNLPPILTAKSTFYIYGYVSMAFKNMAFIFKGLGLLKSWPVSAGGWPTEEVQRAVENGLSKLIKPENSDAVCQSHKFDNVLRGCKGL